MSETKRDWTIAEIEGWIANSTFTMFPAIPAMIARDPPEAEAPGWAEKTILWFCGDSDPNMRAYAMEAIGQLALKLGRLEDEPKIRSIIALGLTNAHAEIRVSAAKAAADLATALGWTFPPRPSRSGP